MLQFALIPSVFFQVKFIEWPFYTEFFEHHFITRFMYWWWLMLVISAFNPIHTSKGKRRFFKFSEWLGKLIGIASFYFFVWLVEKWLG